MLLRPHLMVHVAPEDSANGSYGSVFGRALPDPGHSIDSTAPYPRKPAAGAKLPALTGLAALPSKHRSSLHRQRSNLVLYMHTQAIIHLP
jgi:hypothetical protein